jgi:hypothetical protein
MILKSLAGARVAIFSELFENNIDIDLNNQQINPTSNNNGNDCNIF